MHTVSGKPALLGYCFGIWISVVHLLAHLHGSDGSLLSVFGGTGVRDGPLWSLGKDGSAKLEADLSEAEAELARKTAVNMLAALYERELLPFKTKNYARTKGVLDRVPLEQFMRVSSRHLAGVELENCLEWGPYFKRWPNVTQPYTRLFNCKNKWTFTHSTTSPRASTWFGNTLHGELDSSLDEQGLDGVKGKFDLVIIPQTLQYVVDPHMSARVLYELVKPGGYLVFSTPFMQTIMPYPTDYFRFTAEGSELVLKSAGFQVVKSYVGGDDFWSMCWIMHCGVSDLSPAMLNRALMERGGEYSRNSYMLSAQLARRPELPFANRTG